MPAVVRQTTANLARQAAQGRPVTPQPRCARCPPDRRRARQSQRCAQAFQRSRALDQRYHRAAGPVASATGRAAGGARPAARPGGACPCRRPAAGGVRQARRRRSGMKGAAMLLDNLETEGSLLRPARRQRPPPPAGRPGPRSCGLGCGAVAERRPPRRGPAALPPRRVRQRSRDAHRGPYQGRQRSDLRLAAGPLRPPARSRAPSREPWRRPSHPASSRRSSTRSGRTTGCGPPSGCGISISSCSASGRARTATGC